MIAFDSHELRDICEKREVAETALGLQAAHHLEQQLADIEALENFAELEELHGGLIGFRDGGFRTVNLGPKCMLILRSNHVTAPMLTTGEIDWSKVTRIRIVGVENEIG